MGRSMH